MLARPTSGSCSGILQELSVKLSKYLSPQIYQSIFSGERDVAIRTERKKLTVFFSDIRGFTEISERLEPEDLSEILNDYLSEMSRIVEKHGGTIDKFVGDAIMVFFGAPAATDDRDHALRAVRMAIEMQERMQTLPERWRSHGIVEVFEVRIGINTGHASIGNFGSEGRMDYTAIGRHVNLAARLDHKQTPLFGYLTSAGHEFGNFYLPAPHSMPPGAKADAQSAHDIGSLLARLVTPSK